MEQVLLFLEEHKRKFLVGAVAYVLYVFSQSIFYDLGGMLVHFLINALIFMFVSQALITFAEKVVADRRKETV